MFNSPSNLIGTSVVATLALAAAAHAQPANDNCADAIPLVSGSVMPFDMTGATRDGFMNCSTNGNTLDVWYTYTTTGPELVTVDLCDSPVGTSRRRSLAVFAEGCGGEQVACRRENDCGLARPRITFHAPAAGTYYICIGSLLAPETLVGTLKLNAVPAVPPANDTCATAQVLPGPGEYPFNSVIASTDGPAGECNFNGATDTHDVYFSYTAGNEAYVVFETRSFDSTMQLLDGCSGAVLACNDDALPGVLYSRLCPYPVVAGRTYIVRVASWGAGSAGAVDVLKLSFVDSPPPPYLAPAGALNEPGECGEPLEADPNCACCPGFSTFTDIDPTDVTYQGNSVQRPELGATYSDDDAYRFTIDSPRVITVVGQAQFGVVAMLYRTTGPGCEGINLWGSTTAAAPCGVGNFALSATLPAGTWNFQISHSNSPDDSLCGHNDKYWFRMTSRPECLADLGVQGGVWGVDGLLDNNDFIVFINFFFEGDARADFGLPGGLPGQDGQFDNNDFIAFIDAFFNGCP